MSAWIVRADGSSREVKNLGWLVRNARRVTHFQLDCSRSGSPRLFAFLAADGSRYYRAEFAEEGVLVDWLARRRCFAGLPVFGARGRLIAYLGSPSNSGVRQSLAAHFDTL